LKDGGETGFRRGWEKYFSHYLIFLQSHRGEKGEKGGRQLSAERFPGKGRVSHLSTKGEGRGGLLI